jgi:integral membrane protein (TIGR01906 family)
VDVAIFAVAFAVFGLVALALVWSGDWAYRALARANGVDGATFVEGPLPGDPCGVGGPVESQVSMNVLLEYHREWVAYVTGLDPDPASPAIVLCRPVFTEDEYRHMADVRSVFTGAEVAAIAALGVVAFRVGRSRRRASGLRLVRDGALVAAAGVLAIGIASVFAFDALFLLFHRVFFPQGNFLFDPATSNLLRLYPEWYWQGVTAGVGASFVVLALVTAMGAHLALRRGSNTYTRAA